MKLFAGLLALGMVAWILGPVAGAAERDDKGGSAAATVRKTAEGLHFQLPPDWPVEKRAGSVGPIPIEEYMARKFSALDQRLKTLEQQVGSLDVRVRVLEEEVKRQRLQSKEGIP